MVRPITLILALALLAPAPARAWHKRTPPALQITSGSAGAVANPRWAGYRYVLFDSDADILMTGSQGRQLFLFDLQERDKTDLPAIQQLTTGPGDSQRGSIDFHGRKVVFDALAQGRRQLFLFARATGTTVPLTRGTADSVNASIDDSGRFVVFESTADLLGNNVPGTHVYRIDLALAQAGCPYPCPVDGDSGLTQITLRPGTSRNAATTNKGFTVFESDADLLGTGETETQIYRADSNTGTITALSHGPGAGRNPTISHTGGQIAFESDADLLGNGIAGTHIFLSESPDMPVKQVTYRSGVSERPSLSCKGRGLTFTSNADLLFTGSTGPEVYSYDVTHGLLRQVTNGPSAIAAPVYSAGVFVSFIGDDDLLGTGSSGLQLYLANLFALHGDLP
jgi:Tol biopolymer transport system component